MTEHQIISIGPEDARITVGVDTLSNHAEIAYIYRNEVQIVTRHDVKQIDALIASLEIAKQLLAKHGLQHTGQACHVKGEGIKP